MRLYYYIKKTIGNSAVDDEQDTSRLKEIIEWANKKGIINEDDFVILHNGQIWARDYTFYCNYEDEFYPDYESSETVNVRRGVQETWNQNAVDDYAFYCNRQDQYYSSRNYTEIEVEGDTVCSEVNCDDIYYWESDGENHWEPEEEENESDDGVYQYHGSPKPWNNSPPPKEAIVFGCELELKAVGERSEVAEIAAKYGLFAEEDGSLDDYRGVEIIGGPMSLKDYHSSDNSWMKFLNDVQKKALGWNAGTGYGLHVSVNRAGMSDALVGKMLVFIHGNQSLCEKVAGRGYCDYAKYVNKKITHGRQSRETDKYEALAIRSARRLECRIFRSTLKPEGFLRAVEFVAASVDFCKNAGFQDLTEVKFRKWMEERNNARVYRNLANHLAIKLPKERLKIAEKAELVHAA